MGKTIIGYAPRAFDRPAYIDSYRDHFNSLPFIEKAKKSFHGQTPGNVHWPITSDPLFFTNNQKILNSLGYVHKSKDLLKIISPDQTIICDHSISADDAYGLQSGFCLSPQSDTFCYELSSRQHAVGLLFCLTPDQILNDMEAQNRSAGRWMLDQVVVYRGIETATIPYHRDKGQNKDKIMSIFGILREVNSLVERDDSDSANSLFMQRMYEFDDKHLCDMSPIERNPS